MDLDPITLLNVLILALDVTGIQLILVFFLLNLGQELSVVMMDYLDKGILKDHSQVKEGLMQNGIGIHHFTKQVKEVLKSLNISPNKQHIKF